MIRTDYSLKTVCAPLLFLIAAMFTGNAQAEWLALGRNENFRAYLDQTSLQRNGDLVQVLQLMDFVTAQWADERTVIGSIKTMVEYDCVQLRSRTIALEAYSEQMGEGRKVATEQLSNPDWGGLKSGSMSEKIRQLVCAK